MDQNTTPQSAEPQQSFKDKYGYETLEKLAMKYWGIIPDWLKGRFISWDDLCAIAAVRGHFLSEAELKELVQVDGVNEAIGTSCQFPNCEHQITPVKGLLVDFSTGEPRIDRATQQPIKRGSYLMLVEPDKEHGGPKAVVHLYCSKHSFIARQREGKPPLHLQSLQQAQEKAAVLNARFDEERASLETFREQTGRGRGRPSGYPKGGELPGEGQGRDRGRGRRW